MNRIVEPLKAADEYRTTDKEWAAEGYRNAFDTGGVIAPFFAAMRLSDDPIQWDRFDDDTDCATLGPFTAFMEALDAEQVRVKIRHETAGVVWGPLTMAGYEATSAECERRLRLLSAAVAE